MRIPGLDGVPEGEFAEAALHVDATRFLAREAECLDARRFAEWVELVDEDFRYLVPVPLTPDNPFSPPFDPDCLLLDESKASIVQLWFRRYEKGLYEMAWGENPPVRLRHFVGNVRVRHTADAGLYDVRSNVLLVGVRQGDAPTFLSAERYDLLRQADAGLRLAHRVSVLDQTVLAFPQVRAML